MLEVFPEPRSRELHLNFYETFSTLVAGLVVLPFRGAIDVGAIRPSEGRGREP